MKFELDSDQVALRDEVRAFLDEHVTDEVREELKAHTAMTEAGVHTKQLRTRIAERGWMGVAWPVEFGGQGRTKPDQFLVEAEFERAGIHVGGGGTGAPAIMAAGSEEQKQKFIPGSIRGEVVFAQGYSEPGAGTDLAGIECKAECDGEEYVINGQKVFTTSAHYATHLYLLARTSREENRHAGLSIFLIPMDTPGISVRPLWTVQSEPLPPVGTIYGEPRTNEVFLDNVRVPAECLLGEEGQGWSIGQRGLNLDRVGGWRFVISVIEDERMATFLRDDEVGQELAQDPVVRDRFGEMWIEAQMCRLMTWRSMSIEQEGGQFTYEGAAEKVWGPEHAVRATEAYAQFLGGHGQLLSDSPGTLVDGFFAHNMLGAFQSTVNHGSVQVMRDQIARRGLGLPRG